MDLLMNGLLMAATLFAGGYCWVLGRRVKDLKSLDRGLGGSIVTLTRQIELARATLEEARAASKDTRQDLAQLIVKADTAANELKMMIAAAPVYPPIPARVEPAPTPEPVAVAVPSERLVAERPPLRPVALADLAETKPALRAIDPDSAPPPAPVPSSPPAAMNLAEVPKPKALAPVENPLRRAKGGRGTAAPEASEDAILEALTALAGKGR